MLSTPPLLILVLHCLFKAFPNLFQILAPHDKQTANPTSVWSDAMTDRLVAPICTANILFHTEIQNFFPFLSYSSHPREKKGRDLVLNLPHLLNQLNSSHGTEHCIAITRNSTCSKCPLIQNGEPSVGYSWLHRKSIFSPITWEMGRVSVWGLCPSSVLSCPSLPAGHLPWSKWPRSPGTSHTWHCVELPLSHTFIHKTTALWRRSYQN